MAKSKLNIETENEVLDTRSIKEVRQSKSLENRKLIGTQKPMKETSEVVTIINVFENAGKNGDLVRVRNFFGATRVIDKAELEL